MMIYACFVRYSDTIHPKPQTINVYQSVPILLFLDTQVTRRVVVYAGIYLEGWPKLPMALLMQTTMTPYNASTFRP